MCVACHEPLAVAQSPEAFAERAYIRTLIAQGHDRSADREALVVQYGPAVLAKPPAHGFNLLIYMLPPVLVLIGVAVLAFTLPKWRRRSRAAAEAAARRGPELDPDEARRLDEDLARHHSLRSGTLHRVGRADAEQPERQCDRLLRATDRARSATTRVSGSAPTTWQSR